MSNQPDALAAALNDAALSINSILLHWKELLAPTVARRLMEIRDRADKAASQRPDNAALIARIEASRENDCETTIEVLESLLEDCRTALESK